VQKVHSALAVTGYLAAHLGGSSSPVPLPEDSKTLKIYKIIIIKTTSVSGPI
jgi:hypothetical protein